MTSVIRNLPLGVMVLQKIGCCYSRNARKRELTFKISVLVLTYMAYTCYHMTRKPISVVKSVLHYANCTNVTPPANLPANATDTWCDWAPFDGSDSTALLGTLDSAFLFSYAIFMFVSGFVAERVNLRYFLSMGMIFSGVFTYMFGLAKVYDIHNLWYFIGVQSLAGVFQTTGWPGVVTVLSKWFGKGKRGFIFGVWNSHTSIGNILGTLIAGNFVETDWALSFIVPGLVMACVGVVLFLFLVVEPHDVGCGPTDDAKNNSINRLRKPDNRATNEDYSASSATPNNDETEILVGDQEAQQRRFTERSPILKLHPPSVRDEKAIGFLGAYKIPGVIEYSFCLFFAKLVSYTFLYWLPLYIQQSSQSSSSGLSPSMSADLSTVFDVGGIVGAIAAGMITDYSGMSASTCASMLTAAVPMMFAYQKFGSSSIAASILLLLVVGFLVNGPYALITTAVSADLGTHSSLENNAKALATVTAIIDGTGSLGAAVGPLLAGWVSGRYGWPSVFYMLMVSDVIALLLLTRLVKQEVAKLHQNHIE